MMEKTYNLGLIQQVRAYMERNHLSQNQLAAKGPASLCRGLGQASQGGLHHLALGQALAGVLGGGETQLGVEQPLAL